MGSQDAPVLLAAMGIYSVLAYTVTLRTREIGIRMALGAEPKAITGYMLRRGLSLSIAGIVIGLAGALALTRFMASLIYGVDAFDPATFGIVAGILVFVALAASYFPALRASKIDPVTAFRFE